MERKHIIGGIVLVAVIAIGLGVYMSGEEPPEEEWVELDARAPDDRAGGGDALDGVRRSDRDDREGESAEQARPQAPPLERAAQQEEHDEDLEPPRLSPRQEQNLARSSGWRLGSTRAEIAIVQRRLDRMRTNLATLEQRGEPAVIERQRAVLTRVEARLGALVDEARVLETQASGDGTIGEADQGYEESYRDELPAVTSEVPPG